jgi:hypothetical protein
MRHLRRNGSRALAIFILPTAEASERIGVEIQAFLDAPRACLYAHRMTGEGHADTDLLDGCAKRDRHPRAATYTELAQHVACTLNTVFGSVASQM